MILSQPRILSTETVHVRGMSMEQLVNREQRGGIKIQEDHNSQPPQKQIQVGSM
jgi:hypothetical protein